jgi:hypothetical protein
MRRLLPAVNADSNVCGKSRRQYWAGNVGEDSGSATGSATNGCIEAGLPGNVSIEGAHDEAGLQGHTLTTLHLLRRLDRKQSSVHRVRSR